jgi:hypothetical protein
MDKRDVSLAFDCPFCKAVPQERCHGRAGAICFDSHWQRWQVANNALVHRIAEGNRLALSRERRQRWGAPAFTVEHPVFISQASAWSSPHHMDDGSVSFTR